MAIHGSCMHGSCLQAAVVTVATIPSGKRDQTKFSPYLVTDITMLLQNAAPQTVLLHNDHAADWQHHIPRRIGPDVDAVAFATHVIIYIAMTTHAATPLRAGIANVLNRPALCRAARKSF
jgi:hypothetical protein